jgi:hypothetical protein
MHAYPIFMTILAAQHARSRWMGIIVSRSRDIDKQPARSIHPSGVNNIQLIALLPVDIMGIDFQHVVPALRYPRRLVMEYRHVVIRSKVMHRSLRNLDVGIGIPWQDLPQLATPILHAVFIRTFRFHHQPSSVPCISHVSTPISANVARKVWIRFDRACFRSRYPNCLSANLWDRSISRGPSIRGQGSNVPAIIMRMET